MEKYKTIKKRGQGRSSLVGLFFLLCLQGAAEPCWDVPHETNLFCCLLPLICQKKRFLSKGWDVRLLVWHKQLTVFTFWVHYKKISGPGAGLKLIERMRWDENNFVCLRLLSKLRAPNLYTNFLMYIFDCKSLTFPWTMALVFVDKLISLRAPTCSLYITATSGTPISFLQESPSRPPIIIVLLILLKGWLGISHVQKSVRYCSRLAWPDRRKHRHKIEKKCQKSFAPLVWFLMPASSSLSFFRFQVWLTRNLRSYRLLFTRCL